MNAKIAAWASLRDRLRRDRERRRIQDKTTELLKDGEPCGHPGCLHHITHPCEGCGRIGGRQDPLDELLQDDLEDEFEDA